MKNSELPTISSFGKTIEIASYEHLDGRRNPNGFIELPDGQVFNELKHQAVSAKDSFLADFTHYGRIRPALDFVDGKLVMAVPRLSFDAETGVMVSEPWLITSEKELFPLTPRNLMEKGICSKVPPEVVSVGPRYSGAVLKAFLDQGQVGDLTGTFNFVRNWLQESIDLKDAPTYTFLSLWIMGTYMFEIFRAYPYIHFNGPKGVGKTTALEFLSKVCFNGELASSISASAQFRLISTCSPTLLLDESEQFHRKGLGEVRDILLTGYRKGGSVRRSVQAGKAWRSVTFEVYCPKAFASQRGFEDVLGSRTVKIEMRRSRKGFSTLNHDTAQAIRDACFLVAMTLAGKIHNIYDAINDPDGVVPYTG